METITVPGTHINDVELRPTSKAEPTSTLSIENEDATSEKVLNRSTIVKILALGFSYIFAGLNDGSLGALTPYILRTYHVGTEHVALMYALYPILQMLC